MKESGRGVSWLSSIRKPWVSMATWFLLRAHRRRYSWKAFGVFHLPVLLLGQTRPKSNTGDSQTHKKSTLLFRLTGAVSQDSSLLWGSLGSPLAWASVKDYDALVSDALYSQPEHKTVLSPKMIRDHRFFWLWVLTCAKTFLYQLDLYCVNVAGC